MKSVCPFFFFLFCVCAIAQNGYPVPEKTPTRLFYIQHNQNHNTYVYDANMEGASIDRKNPVREYRIVYTEGGIEKPLTKIQKRMVYGLVVKYLGPDFYEMHLAADKRLKLYLKLNAKGKPEVYATVNNRRMYPDRMFIKLKENTSGIGAQLEYALFTGRDFDTGREITEKMEM